MEKRLNVRAANEAMEARGLTQTALAKQLQVSREAVSQWFNDKSFPRPNKLLKLAKLLNLDFTELVIREDDKAPVIAFRKMRGTRTKDHHVEKAREIGKFLRHLVPYLPFSTLEVPPILKSPSLAYEYIQTVATQIRSEIKVGEDEEVNFTHLIHRFTELQTVLVPVLWGSKQRHENAVHIYLPDSGTTWVYLNLDVNVHDFKFWMAHELGHCLTPSFRGDDAEDFADAFAGALLFSETKAEFAYAEISRKRRKKTQILCLVDLAVAETISPYTVYKQLNAYARHHDLPALELEPDIFGYISKLNKSYMNLSEALFANKDKVEAKDFIQTFETEFETPFFRVLSKFLKASRKGVGFVQLVTDLPLLDARGIYDELR